MNIPAHILDIASKLQQCPKIVAERWNKLPGGKPQARIVTGDVSDLCQWILGQAEKNQQPDLTRKPRTASARQGRNTP